MPEPRSTMIDPPIEDLLDKVDSKFTLVTLASKRGRQINSYFNQLGEGLGAIVPPQVTSVARKPLSIALEEIAASKVRAGAPIVEIDETEEVVLDEVIASDEDPDASSTSQAINTAAPVMDGPSTSDELGALRGATVVLGVTGGIAAYKAVEVCRRLVDAGATVLPVLTQGALRFVGATTFSALASEPVRTSLFDDADPIPHTRLGRRADLVVVCPATARLLGEYAAGISRDLLVATLLATRAPVLICPAMHTEMWLHPAVAENLASLRRRGVRVVEPTSGRLAGGDVGEGRLADPSAIVAAAAALLDRPRDLAGCTVLVTAGGTREPIDAVRFLSNRSSGRQGHALAEAAARRGASVTLVTTTELAVPQEAEVVRVETAAELAQSVLQRAPQCDVVIMAAAVADYTVAAPAERKWKKRDGPPPINLVETEDVLAALGAKRHPGQVLVGFAAETDDIVANAERKLAEKGADLLVVNDVSAPGVGFGHETNAVTILGRRAGSREISLRRKSEIADAVLDAVVERRAENASSTS